MDVPRHHYPSAFAQFVGTRFAFPFWKGRVALYAILKGLGVGSGDEVILPGYTCVMNVNPIIYLGAKPIYVDVEPNTFNIAPAAVTKRISTRTKVIIVQHTYGYSAAVAQILTLSREHSIHVVEDCCLALGSEHDGKRVGAFGIAAYFSSQWSKPYTTGLGGMAVTNDELLARRMDELYRTEVTRPASFEVGQLAAQLAMYRLFFYPRTAALGARAFRRLSSLGLAVGSSEKSEFHPSMRPDFFKGMSKFQMKSGQRSLAIIEQNMAHRRNLARVYDSLLSAAGWPNRAVPSNMTPVLVRYPVRCADKARALAEAPRHGLEIGSWFESPLHPMETSLKDYGYHEGECPVAEEACRQVVNLPLHPRVTERTARRTVDFLTRIGPAA